MSVSSRVAHRDPLGSPRTGSAAAVWHGSFRTTVVQHTDGLLTATGQTALACQGSGWLATAGPWKEGTNKHLPRAALQVGPELGAVLIAVARHLAGGEEPGHRRRAGQPCAA